VTNLASSLIGESEFIRQLPIGVSDGVRKKGEDKQPETILGLDRICPTCSSNLRAWILK